MNDIEKARKKKRGATGWTLDEIKKKVQQERDAYKKLGTGEPDALASGKDMKNVLEERDENKHD